MARRTPKPFTVEVRRSGRKPAAAAGGPANPFRAAVPDDQPHVSWPGLDIEPVAVSPSVQAKVAPPVTGRILPALIEPAVIDVKPEPQRRPRSPARLPSPPSAEPLIEEIMPLSMGVAVDAPAREITASDNGLPQQGRKRLSRDCFKQGERWKARLPAAAHRRQRGRNGGLL